MSLLLIRDCIKLIRMDESRSKTPTPSEPTPAPERVVAKPFIHPSRLAHSGLPAEATDIRRPSGVQQQREPENTVASAYDSRQQGGNGGRYGAQSSRSVSQVSYTPLDKAESELINRLLNLYVRLAHLQGRRPPCLRSVFRFRLHSEI